MNDDQKPTRIPMPRHLVNFYWYPPHIAWLEAQGKTPIHLQDDRLYPDGVEPKQADLRHTYLKRASLDEADLRGAILPDGVPVIDNIDLTIYKAITTDGVLNQFVFDVMSWHSDCGTSHCRAGWAIHLAGEKGKDLEERLGPNCAGALIYAASRPDLPVPNFYLYRNDAFADIKACAEGGAK
jgi:hypothetical protein